MRNKMAEDRGGTSNLSHLQRTNSEMWRHRWIFPPVTPSKLCQSYYCARSYWARSACQLSARCSRDKLAFYFLPLEQNCSLNQFCNKHYKCLLLCLSHLNLTIMREPSRALTMISHKKRKKIAILTTPQRSWHQQHTAHETDINTIKETNSMHTKWCNIFAAKNVS